MPKTTAATHLKSDVFDVMRTQTAIGDSYHTLSEKNSHFSTFSFGSVGFIRTSECIVVCTLPRNKG